MVRFSEKLAVKVVRTTDQTSEYDRYTAEFYQQQPANYTPAASSQRKASV